MRSALAIALACGLCIAALSTVVAAADEAPVPLLLQPDEARAGMCEAYDGLAFTFCVALCEARQCDLVGADDGTCALLRRGFARASAGAAAPCVSGPAATQPL